MKKHLPPCKAQGTRSNKRGVILKKTLIYIHGKGGSAEGAERYKPICPDYDVIGAEYDGSFPSAAQVGIKEAYDKAEGEVTLLTESIGTYFAMHTLQKEKIKKALFISPILDMEKLILDMMSWANVSEEMLKKKSEIKTNFGETLSWDYLCFVREHPISWSVPTDILYAEKDNLTSINTVNDFAARHGSAVTVMKNGEHWFHTKEQLAFLDKWLLSSINR